jgi:hypothetical protein
MKRHMMKVLAGLASAATLVATAGAAGHSWN